MITEAKAATKWCPEAVASHTDPRAGFHEHDTLQSHNHICIASKCMAWRWVKEHVARNDGHPLGTKIAGGPMQSPALGYCGKAGTP